MTKLPLQKMGFSHASFELLIRKKVYTKSFFGHKIILPIYKHHQIALLLKAKILTCQRHMIPRGTSDDFQLVADIHFCKETDFQKNVQLAFYN